MKVQLREVHDHGIVYQALMFVCPGCVAAGPEGVSGLHLLPVNVWNNGINKPWWKWNGDLENPTLSPSILTKSKEEVCHSYLENGEFRFLTDCTHSLSGQEHVPMPDLPAWVTEDYVDETKEDSDG